MTKYFKEDMAMTPESRVQRIRILEERIKEMDQVAKDLRIDVSVCEKEIARLNDDLVEKNVKLKLLNYQLDNLEDEAAERLIRLNALKDS